MNYQEAAAVLGTKGFRCVEYATTLHEEESGIVMKYRGFPIMEWHPDGTISLSLVAEAPLGPHTRMLVVKRINKYLPVGWSIKPMGKEAWHLVLGKPWTGAPSRFWIFYDGITIQDDDIASLPF